MQYPTEPDTQALKTFIAIAESNSLSDAARRTGVTQPAISQALKNLEKMFGVVLVERRSKPVKLTAAGNVLKRNADMIVGDLRRLNAKVRDSSARGLIQCRMGLVTSCSEVFGSKLISRLSQKAQKLTFRSGLTPLLKEAFLKRDIDILISDDPIDGFDNFEVYQLFRDPMLMIAPTTELETKSYNIESIVGKLPLIKFGRHTHIGIYTEITLRRMRLITDVYYETDDSHTMINFVRDGHGWGILSCLCLAQCIHFKGQFLVLELDDTKHGRNIHLVCRKGELGSLPQQIANTIRQIFIHETFPNLKQIAPWLKPHSFGTLILTKSAPR